MIIINDYNGSSISVISSNSNKAILRLKNEGDAVSHYFAFKCKNNSDKYGEIKILDIDKSPYSQGYINYYPFFRYDNLAWNRFEKENCIISKSHIQLFIQPKSEYEIAWFPTYTMRNLYEFMSGLNGHPQVSIITHNKQFPQINIGSIKNPACIFFARQHPGETMGSFFIEGVIQYILNNLELARSYYFVFFPIVNIKGVESGCHRITDEIDYNRRWKKKSPFEIELIKKVISTLNIRFIVDIHGDEISKKDYLRASNYSKKLFSVGDTELLANYGLIRKILKAIIFKKNLSGILGHTAKDYLSKHYNCPVFLYEISAFCESANMCNQRGKDFIQNIIQIFEEI